MKPLVSAIIPAFNQAAFIADAIKSVQWQTYGRTECVVVDDGSTDSTAHILDTFGSSIRRVHTSNRGLSAARNTGIEASSGDFIAFLDADDVWLPRKIEAQVDAIKAQREAGLVYAGFHIVTDALDFVGRVDPPDSETALRRTLLIERPTVSLAQSGFVPREVFREVGLFDERLTSSEDYDLTCRIGFRFPLLPVDRPLSLYRIHPGQLHRNLELIQRNVLLVQESLFADPHMPAELQPYRRYAESNLNVSLAGGYAAQKRWGKVIEHAGKAFVLHPGRIAAAMRRLATDPRPLKIRHHH